MTIPFPVRISSSDRFDRLVIQEQDVDAKKKLKFDENR